MENTIFGGVGRLLKLRSQDHFDSSLYERLRTTIYGLITVSLETEKIDFLQLQTRLKSRKSIRSKLSEKNYENGISDVTDIVGARIILYLERDIKEAERVLRDVFEIDETNSVDKLSPDSSRMVGYRSLHLICTLGKRRKGFLEYKGLTDLKFEIQIRTALQHAWAEIEHKQNYKSNSYLPPQLERRLMLLSGALENADREFSEIVTLAENYGALVESLDDRVIDDSLSSVALRAIVNRYIKKSRVGKIIDISENYPHEEKFLSLLSNYGIKTVCDLDLLMKKITQRELRDFSENCPAASWYRLPQLALLISDSDNYIKTMSQNGDWALSEAAWKYLDDRNPPVDWRHCASKHEVKILTEIEEAESGKQIVRFLPFPGMEEL